MLILTDRILYHHSSEALRVNESEIVYIESDKASWTGGALMSNRELNSANDSFLRSHH